MNKIQILSPDSVWETAYGGAPRKQEDKFKRESEATIDTNKILANILEKLANKIVLNQDKPFHETFKNGEDMPYFNGQLR